MSINDQNWYVKDNFKCTSNYELDCIAHVIFLIKGN